MKEWNQANAEERKLATLEAIKFFVGFGAPTGLVDDVIYGIAKEIKDLKIPHEQVFVAIYEAREALASGKTKNLFEDLEEEVEKMFSNNIENMVYLSDKRSPEGGCLHTTNKKWLTKRAARLAGIGPNELSVNRLAKKFTKAQTM